MFTAAAHQHTTADRVINSLDDYLHQMEKLWITARNSLLMAQANQKSFYDLKRRHEELFIGDEVYLSTLRQFEYGQIKFPSMGNSTKFEPRYLGPFKIIGKPSTHAYELDLPKSIQIYPVIHIRYLLRPRIAKRFPNRMSSDYRAFPIIVENVPEYEVDSIHNKRVRKYGKGSRVEYLVHWKGYPPEEDTWEPLSNLTNCQELLNEFELHFVTSNNIMITETFNFLV